MADKTKKTVELERAVSKSPQKTGSFGFSIMGGAKAKIPAIVCNIEEGGPADLSRKVSVTKNEDSHVYFVRLKLVIN